jgi:hypothetical protein
LICWRPASVGKSDIAAPIDHGAEPLAAVAVTMPPWPGENEAYFVEGKWRATVGG